MTAGKREEVTKEKEVGTSENRHKRRENVGFSTCLHYYALIIQHARGVNQNNCAYGLIFFSFFLKHVNVNAKVVYTHAI